MFPRGCDQGHAEKNHDTHGERYHLVSPEQRSRKKISSNYVNARQRDHDTEENVGNRLNELIDPIYRIQARFRAFAKIVILRQGYFLASSNLVISLR